MRYAHALRRHLRSVFHRFVTILAAQELVCVVAALREPFFLAALGGVEYKYLVQVLVERV